MSGTFARVVGWAEPYVEEACAKAEAWFRKLPSFPNRVNLGTVVQPRGPTLLSEQDSVIQFARHLHQAGVPWEDMHYELTLSKWMFTPSHPAASIADGTWRVDLALVRQADLPGHRPERDDRFQFEAFFEFAYLGDYWRLPGAVSFGKPKSWWRKVEDDVKKVEERYVLRQVCRVGYVIVFEECDCEFPPNFRETMEQRNPGCRVRFVRGW
jgi:hypothetical protein